MQGQNVWETSFKRNFQAIIMGSKTSNTSQVPNSIDPQLLLKRLILISEQQYILTRETYSSMNYASYPDSLFEDFVLPRKANKSALALAIWSKVEKCKDFFYQMNQISLTLSMYSMEAPYSIEFLGQSVSYFRIFVISIQITFCQ